MMDSSTLTQFAALASLLVALLVLALQSRKEST